MNTKRFQKYAPLALMLAGAALANAQVAGGVFSQAAQGVSQETVTASRWVAIALCAICGLSLISNSEHHMVAKVSGLVLGLIFVVLASPIVNWVASL